MIPEQIEKPRKTYISVNNKGERITASSIMPWSKLACQKHSKSFCTTVVITRTWPNSPAKMNEQLHSLVGSDNNQGLLLFFPLSISDLLTSFHSHLLQSKAKTTFMSVVRKIHCFFFSSSYPDALPLRPMRYGSGEVFSLDMFRPW